MSPEEIFKTMQKLIAEQFALNPDEITMDSSFEEDLGADSVDLVELVMAMEEEFELDEIPEEELTSLKTVDDMYLRMLFEYGIIVFICAKMET